MNLQTPKHARHIKLTSVYKSVGLNDTNKIFINFTLREEPRTLVACTTEDFMLTQIRICVL